MEFFKFTKFVKWWNKTIVWQLVQLVVLIFLTPKKLISFINQEERSSDTSFSIQEENSPISQTKGEGEEEAKKKKKLSSCAIQFLDRRTWKISMAKKCVRSCWMSSIQTPEYRIPKNRSLLVKSLLAPSKENLMQLNFSCNAIEIPSRMACSSPSVDDSGVGIFLPNAITKPPALFPITPPIP